MNKTLLIISLIIFPTLSVAQTSWSTNYINVCYWDANQEKWTDCSSKNEYNSLFIVNKDETMITHTISELKSAYYVKSSEYSEEDADNGLFSYSVTSDVGNDYLINFLIKFN